METLDGEDMASYFDFYFEPSPMNPTHWVFKDEEAREDFVSGAQDEGCMVSLKEVCGSRPEAAVAPRFAKPVHFVTLACWV